MLLLKCSAFEIYIFLCQCLLAFSWTFVHSVKRAQSILEAEEYKLCKQHAGKDGKKTPYYSDAQTLKSFFGVIAIRETMKSKTLSCNTERDDGAKPHCSKPHWTFNTIAPKKTQEKVPRCGSAVWPGKRLDFQPSFNFLPKDLLLLFFYSLLLFFNDTASANTTPAWLGKCVVRHSLSISFLKNTFWTFNKREEGFWFLSEDSQVKFWKLWTTKNANHDYHGNQVSVRRLTFGQAFTQWVSRRNMVFCQRAQCAPPPLVFGAQKSAVRIRLTAQL